MTDAVQARGYRASRRVFDGMWSDTPQSRIAGAALSGAAAAALAVFGFLLHLPLSAAEPLELLLVLLAALRLGFLPASVASIVAVLCLDYLFTQPLFQLTVVDPRNWISLVTFETIALSVSRLSSEVRLHAAEAEEQQRRAVTLYELSRAILHLQQQRPTAEQLTPLIREFVGVTDVVFWTTLDESPTGAELAPSGPVQAAYDAYLQQRDRDDFANGSSSRVLRLGMTVIGGMTLRGWSPDLLMADAVASLAAVAFERARANREESRAELARDAEQLRTAVLDGLAHGFKTPLTAIQTASSGLLALGKLNPMQAELISIIDDRATMLSQLTRQLLQTAALDAKQIRLHRKITSLQELANNVVREQETAIRSRMLVRSSRTLASDDVDAPLFELALQQLVDNASKYSAAGTPIQIAVEQGEWETVVSVKNVGTVDHPIRPEERTKVFERFYRGDRDEYGPAGTGLGLSVVKKVAEAHGGRAWVECGDNTVCFSLSVARARKDVTHGEAIRGDTGHGDRNG